MQPKIFAKTIVVNSKGQVLLIRRSKTDEGRPGEQDFPGGNVEPGEELTIAASREIQEEAGIVIAPRDLQLIYAATVPYVKDSASVTRLLFVGHTEDPEVVLSFEHDAYEWVTVEEALQKFPHFFYNVGLKYAADHNLL